MKRLLALLLMLSILLCGCVPAPGGAVPSGGKMTVHYIDVGQADCALLESEGQYILIDGGNVADGKAVVDYLLDAGVKELAAVFCTHAHEDHVGGLAAVLEAFPAKAVYAPTRTYASNCFDQFLYYADQQRLTVQIPEPGTVLTFGDATVTVLGPLKSYPDPNDTSLVLMVRFGGNRFLFTGDMERTAETDLLDANVDVKADVLKVGHHGSSTSTSYRFLYMVDPDHAVISVGKDNDYGHPHEEPLSRLEDAEVSVYRTDLLGTILAVSDGKNITFAWGNRDASPEIPSSSPDQTVQYIGNKSSKVLHLPTCSSLPAEKNRVYFDNYADAEAEGYHPCSRCMG